jgi:N-acetylmuramoyl-L-alanine amidase
MKYALFLLISFAVFINSCTTGKYAATNKVYKQQAKTFAGELKKQPANVDSATMATQWVGTTNFGMRKPNFVIIHHTAQSACDTTLRTFTLPRTQVSAHYVICKDGTINHMLNDYLRAWHAGAGRWGNVTDINSVSIGIELDNNGFEPFTDSQIKSLLVVLKKLKQDNNIPSANFIGHADIAPKRKVDPNKYFPWQQLAANGFGYWYDITNVKLPENFDAIQALRIIGYDVQDSVAAIRAFKLHFVQNDDTPVLTDIDRKVIYDLYKKY